MSEAVSLLCSEFKLEYSAVRDWMLAKGISIDFERVDAVGYKGKMKQVLLSETCGSCPCCKNYLTESGIAIGTDCDCKDHGKFDRCYNCTVNGHCDEESVVHECSEEEDRHDDDDMNPELLGSGTHLSLPV